MSDPHEEILTLVEEARKGVPNAAARLLPLVYEDLRRIAGGMIRGERVSHTLQPTALVNEACLKLMGGEDRAWEGREHFLAVAAIAMRQVLVNHARSRNALKRGGHGDRVTLFDPVDVRAKSEDVDILALEEVLRELEQEDPQIARLIELRYFAGMNLAQAAIVMEVSERTLNRLWRAARAELATRLGGAEDAS
jgi:RNA polymerase sigma factor (TIGR02999 family)